MSWPAMLRWLGSLAGAAGGLVLLRSITSAPDSWDRGCTQYYYLIVRHKGNFAVDMLACHQLKQT